MYTMIFMMFIRRDLDSIKTQTHTHAHTDTHIYRIFTNVSCIGILGSFDRI